MDKSNYPEGISMTPYLESKLEKDCWHEDISFHRGRNEDILLAKYEAMSGITDWFIYIYKQYKYIGSSHEDADNKLVCHLQPQIKN